MVKRRKLEAPSAAELNQIEEEFRRETSPNAMTAPITQVAAEAAALAQPVDAQTRKYKADSEALKAAEAEGRLMAMIPLDHIEADAMVRDRSMLNEADLEELKASISLNGLRLPIEVYELAEPGEAGGRYGLLSGYRRLRAYRDLLTLSGQEKYQAIPAIIREAKDAQAGFVAMVEENEVRSDLSHFERGRIAVIAAQQGAFVNVEEAVNQLFAAASKAKRSKIRSFAMIFEELGDILEYPEALTEKQGLKLATALRGGAEKRLRDNLVETPEGPDEEWALIEAELAAMDRPVREAARGGRPKKKPMVGWSDADTIRTSTGVTIRKGHDGRGHVLRIEGRVVDGELIDSVMLEIQRLLEKP